MNALTHAWLDGLFYDLRLTLRGLRRDWAFTLAAIAMLALAIGLNVTVFTVMNAMLFRGFPLVKRSDRLVYIDERKPSGARASLSYPDFEAWRSQAQAFEGMAFSGGGGPITFRAGDGRPIDMSMERVSANTFGVLGVRPMLGRDFVPADEAPGATPVAILSYRFWESRFGKRAGYRRRDRARQRRARHHRRRDARRFCPRVRTKPLDAVGAHPCAPRRHIRTTA